MNQMRIEKLIPIAFNILEEENDLTKTFMKKFGEEKKIESAYKGYMSSIGPSIVQAGLIKTITAFSKEKKGGEGERKIICDLIKMILEKSNHYIEAEKSKELKDIILNRINNKPTFTRIKEEDRILEAITAYKLVFDTYAKYEKKKEAAV